MKLNQIPMGARFEYKGMVLTKTGPMTAATEKGGQHFIPKFAVLKPVAGEPSPLPAAESRTLLGAPPPSTFFKWKAGQVGQVSRDVLERVSYVLGIYKALQVLLPSPAAAGMVVATVLMYLSLGGSIEVEAGEPTPLELDMLWQLAMPRLGQIDDARIVALLAANPRGRDASIDLATVRDAAVRVLGRESWRQALDRAKQVARDDGARNRIEALR